VTTRAPSTSLQVRAATQADLLEIYRIERASFPQPWPFGAFEQFLGEPGFLVGSLPEVAVAGYIVADTMPNHGRPLGHVKDLAVHPDHRGTGIGASLLQGALDVMTACNAQWVKLEVREGNDHAIDLYRGFGFEHHHTIPRYYENGDDALVMVRVMD
jgi:ribosomal-protein-alanine N-acetyltransferase